MEERSALMAEPFYSGFQGGWSGRTSRPRYLMLIPIHPADPLVVQQRVQRVGLGGKTPFDPLIVTETGNEDSFPFLRNTMIGRVDQRGDDIVGEVITGMQPAAGFFRLKPPVVALPLLATPSYDLGKFQLQQNVLKVVGEAGTGQSLHVLDDKGAWLQFPDNVDHHGKHVPFVIVRPMLPPHGKRLAWRPTGHQVDSLGETGKVKSAHIPLGQRPIRHQGKAAPLIIPDGVAGVFVPLDHGQVFKSRDMHSHAQATGPAKQFN